MSLASAVARRSSPTVVTRRAIATVGSDGRVTEGATSTETVSLAIQPGSGGTMLDRQVTGDSTVGEIRVWVTVAALAVVGWTELQIAPAEDASGPPGDRVTWNGRVWEITRDEDWSGSGAFQRYIASQRGAA